MLKKNFGRFYVTQGNSKVQQGPASWITLINILLSSQEISNADAVPSNADNHSTTRRSHKQSLPVIIESGPSDLVIHGSRSQCSLGISLSCLHSTVFKRCRMALLPSAHCNLTSPRKKKRSRTGPVHWHGRKRDLQNRTELSLMLLISFPAMTSPSASLQKGSLPGRWVFHPACTAPVTGNSLSGGFYIIQQNRKKTKIKQTNEQENGPYNTNFV